jgi:hypothetical protein
MSSLTFIRGKRRDRGDSECQWMTQNAGKTSRFVTFSRERRIKYEPSRDDRVTQLRRIFKVGPRGIEALKLFPMPAVELHFAGRSAIGPIVAG